MAGVLKSQRVRSLIMEHLIEHQITLRFLKPDDVTIGYSLQEVLLRRCSKIPGWMTRYRDGLEYEQFEVYQPEYDEVIPQDGVLKGSTIWTITFGASVDIPLTDQNITDGLQVSAAYIAEQIRGLVSELFPSLKYLRSTERRKFEYSRSSNLAF